MAVVASWDGAARRIYLATASFAPVDLYREYRAWRRLNESARVWDPLLKMDGYIPKGGGKFTPRYMTLLDGTKIVPQDLDHTLTIDGEIITDDPDADPATIDTSGLSAGTSVFIDYRPSEAEIILVNTGSAVTAQDKLDIAGQVWATPLAGNQAGGTFGEYVSKKLLNLKSFIGLG